MNEIVEAKYYSISVNQLTVVLRCVASNGDVSKRFLEFIPIDSQKGEDLLNTMLKKLTFNTVMKVSVCEEEKDITTTDQQKK